MNAESILSTGIANIDTVYGGVRGTTLSSRHNLRHWQTIAESGIRTVIELRNEDHSGRLCRLCKEYDIYYFPFPLGSHSCYSIRQNNGDVEEYTRTFISENADNYAGVFVALDYLQYNYYKWEQMPAQIRNNPTIKEMVAEWQRAATEIIPQI